MPNLNIRIRNLITLLCLSSVLGACSMGKIVAKSSLPLMQGGAVAMNQETDLAIAEAAIPANLKMLEGMINTAPDVEELHSYAAQGFYGYAYAFVEPKDVKRASALYQRCFNYGRKALGLAGIDEDITIMPSATLHKHVSKLEKSALPALFWTGSCWGKLIDTNRDSPALIAQLSNVATLMHRALELDSGYFYGGPHMFFGVYYGARPPMFGGDFDKSRQHFDAARPFSNNQVLIIDVLQAQFLARQMQDRDSFHTLLTRVINEPEGGFPEMALSNAIAKRIAIDLLAQEDDLF